MTIGLFVKKMIYLDFWVYVISLFVVGVLYVCVDVYNIEKNKKIFEYSVLVRSSRRLAFASLGPKGPYLIIVQIKI